MISVANAAFDPDTGYLRGTSQVRLARQHCIVLRALAARPGTVVSHDRLLSALWGNADNGPDMSGLKVAVCHLRKRMRAAGVDAEIVRHFGAGYSLRVDGIDNQPLTISPQRAAILDTILGRALAHWPELVREWEATG